MRRERKEEREGGKESGEEEREGEKREGAQEKGEWRTPQEPSSCPGTPMPR
jgi:hypothetical protein